MLFVKQIFFLSLKLYEIQYVVVGSSPVYLKFFVKIQRKIRLYDQEFSKN